MWAASDSPPRPIETFVFMDLEATGLPPSRPKIAEMCLFAVSRHALENPQYSNCFPKPAPLFPRLVDKLSICVNPDKPFTPAASCITGLTNEAFARNKKQSFNRHILQTMVSFFNRQHPPICLVAHNGCRYDFPLLKAELSTLGLLPFEEIYCADTIIAMKALDNETNQLHQFGYQPNPAGSRKRYALRDLYFKFYKVYPLNSHNAEGDVLTLISVFQQRARDLMCWMDSNARPFNTIRVMYKEYEKDISISKTPRNIQPSHTSRLQMWSQRSVATSSLFSDHDDDEPADNNYPTLSNTITDDSFFIPVGIKNILVCVFVLIIVWAALKNPV